MSRVVINSRGLTETPGLVFREVGKRESWALKGWWQGLGR